MTVTAGRIQNRTDNYGVIIWLQGIGYNEKERLRKTSLRGGAYGIRTRDLLTASQTRSQLRQCPMCFGMSVINFIIQ